jgi:Ser/Thr protein kinase RdoA (MazF antagonist)
MAASEAGRDDDAMATRPSAHERFRAGLEVVSDTAVVIERLVAGGAIDDRPWTRHFGRFHPDRDEWATIVLESVGAEPVTVGFHGNVGTDELLEHCSVRPFHADTRLTRLGDTMRALTVDNGRVDIVRYRPESRCMLRVTAPDGVRYVKVAPGWRELDVIGQAVWATAERGELGVAVAEPLGTHDERMEVHQGVVAGSPIFGAVVGPGGPAWSHRLGEALGRLATSSLAVTDRFGPVEQLARTNRALRRAAVRIPSLEPRLDDVAGALADLHDQQRDPRLVPTHGAPHVHQWLADGERLGLVDFDRCAFGEPELDVATYLAELDTESGLHDDVADHEAAMIAGFAATAWPLDPSRLWLHRVHKRCAKVSRTAIALRPDGDRRAERHLTAVESLLAHRP